MNRVLRVCLAMGGGVSLGSFSGAALTESLKLLLIFGKDKNGDPYDRVLVDGMSGASAGAIALTIMLRCLLDYDAMLSRWDSDPEVSEYVSNTTKENILKEQLKFMYFDNKDERYNAIPETKRKNLLSLELAQEIQKTLWVYAVDAKKLYDKKIKEDHQINDSFGLLDRGIMEKLIKDYLVAPIKAVDMTSSILDSNRILFACSLTNLLPTSQNISGEKVARSLKDNILNSTGLFNHAELRVIDFVFNREISNKKPSDSRWLKFLNAEDITEDQIDKDTITFDLKTPESWAIISASALACGAFPIAFSPLLLKRYKEEFEISRTTKEDLSSSIEKRNQVRNTVKAAKENEADSDEYITTEWPLSFYKLQEHLRHIDEKHQLSRFNDEGNSKITYDHFNFPYIDGGTFNNEPIKEAYRIASFQDFAEDRSTCERVVLFVDPIVRKEKAPSLNVASFRPINGKKPPRESSEINKLVSSVQSLVGLLVNQGRAKEGGKISSTLENLELKDTLFDYLEENENVKLTGDVCLTAFSKIRATLSDHIISIGTRSPLIYFINELEKTSKAEWAGRPIAQLIKHTRRIEEQIFELLSKREQFLKEHTNGTFNLPMAEIYEPFGINGSDTSDINSQRIFAKTVFRVIADISLDTAGKNKEAILAAILPINLKNEIIDLPGTEDAAFAGFASVEAKKYAFEYGRLSALLALKSEKGFRAEEKGGAYLRGTDEDMKKVYSNLLTSVRDTKFYSVENDYPNALREGLYHPSKNRLLRIIGIHKGWKNITFKTPTAILGFLSIFPALIAGPAIAISGAKKRKARSLSGVVTSIIKEKSEAVYYENNLPILINIKGKGFKKSFWRWINPLKKNDLVKMIAVVDGEEKKIHAFWHKDKQTEEESIYFKLYICKEKLIPQETQNSQEGDNNKVNDSLNFTKDIRIVLDRRTELPEKTLKSRNIDPNLDIPDYISKRNEKLPKKITKLIINGIEDDVLFDYKKHINNKNKSLIYSLNALKHHVNPMLQMDLTEKTDWYFKENTKAFDEVIL